MRVPDQETLVAIKAACEAVNDGANAGLYVNPWDAINFTYEQLFNEMLPQGVKAK